MLQQRMINDSFESHCCNRIRKGYQHTKHARLKKVNHIVKCMRYYLGLHFICTPLRITYQVSTYRDGILQ